MSSILHWSTKVYSILFIYLRFKQTFYIFFLKRHRYKLQCMVKEHCSLVILYSTTLGEIDQMKTGTSCVGRFSDALKFMLSAVYNFFQMLIFTQTYASKLQNLRNYEVIFTQVSIFLLYFMSSGDIPTLVHQKRQLRSILFVTCGARTPPPPPLKKINKPIVSVAKNNHTIIT